MTTPDTQKYLFDLYGYLVIEGVLTAEEVSELNRLIDESGHTSTDEVSGTLPGGGAGEEGAGFLEWGQAFTKVLDHPKVMPVLRMIIGDGFRIDHFWGAWANAGAKALHLHGGVVPFVQTDYYYVREGKIRSGLTNMAWNLADSGGELGGFMALPGSHKSNFEVPDEIREATEGYGIDVPEVKAGSVSIFTEAVLPRNCPMARQSPATHPLLQHGAVAPGVLLASGGTPDNRRANGAPKAAVQPTINVQVLWPTDIVRAGVG